MRIIKRLIIIFIVLSILASIGFLIYWKNFRPTCFDGKQNGREEGIDCGGPCIKVCKEEFVFEKIEIKELEFVEEGGKYDVVARLHNPNPGHGLEKLDYKFILYNNEEEVGSRQGETYILPSEEKYVVEAGLEINARPLRVELELKEGEPQKFSETYPKLEVVNERHSYPEESGKYFQTRFQIVNRSTYDFEVIDLTVVVRSEDGEIIALNKGYINSMVPQGVRDHEFFWPREIPYDDDAAVEVEARSNVFDFSNIRI